MSSNEPMLDFRRGTIRDDSIITQRIERSSMKAVLGVWKVHSIAPELSGVDPPSDQKLEGAGPRFPGCI